MDRFIQRTRRTNDTTSNPTNNTQAQPEPPRKRRRVEDVRDSNSEYEESTTTASVNGDDDDENVSVAGVMPRAAKQSAPGSDADDEAVDDQQSGHQTVQTVLEDSLPAVATDKEAIEEYEVMRASQLSQAAQDDAENDASARLDSRQWVLGRSSIYVDAFNLALDTVLEDESHLFDAREARVFEQWRSFSYEAQYL
jgi:Fanconi-associated nuclease 1